MDLKGKTKIIAAVAVVAVVLVVLVLAIGGSDDHDYSAQAKQEIDKYGYDAEITGYDVERGVNAFGVSIINVSGTFVSDGENHDFVLTTLADHSLLMLTIDDYTYTGDDIGDASYNYTAKEIGGFTYQSSYGYTYTESPGEGMTFVLVELTLKNVGHSDGLTITAPDFENSEGNIFGMDYTATTHYDSSYGNLSYSSLGLGNQATVLLVYEVPEGTADGEVHWSNMDIDVYGYVLDRTLEPA